MEGTQMQSVIIIQLAPNTSHLTTCNIDGLHTCVYGNSWSGYTKCVHSSKIIPQSGVPLLSQEE